MLRRPVGVSFRGFDMRASARLGQGRARRIASHDGQRTSLRSIPPRARGDGCAPRAGRRTRLQARSGRT